MEKKLLACFVGIPIILMVLLSVFLMYQSYEKGKSKEAYTISLTQDAIHFDGIVDDVVDSRYPKHGIQEKTLKKK